MQRQNHALEHLCDYHPIKLSRGTAPVPGTAQVLHEQDLRRAPMKMQLSLPSTRPKRAHEMSWRVSAISPQCLAPCLSPSDPPFRIQWSIIERRNSFCNRNILRRNRLGHKGDPDRPTCRIDPLEFVFVTRRRLLNGDFPLDFRVFLRGGALRACLSCHAGLAAVAYKRRYVISQPGSMPSPSSARRSGSS